jgi:hypothetical protein
MYFSSEKQFHVRESFDESCDDDHGSSVLSDVSEALLGAPNAPRVSNRGSKSWDSRFRNNTLKVCLILFTFLVVVAESIYIVQIQRRANAHLFGPSMSTPTTNVILIY